LLDIGGYTESNQFGLRMEYRELMRKLIEFFVAERGAQVLLVPHVWDGPAGKETDVAACQRVFESLGQPCREAVHQLEGKLNHHHVKWVIGQCEFFLGSRMHACIGAISQAVPTLGLAYSRKFAGVFGSMGVPELVVDLTAQDLDKTLRLVAERFEQRHELKQRLEKVAPNLRQSVLRLFEEVGT